MTDMARPSDYTKKLGELICDRVAQGENIDRIAEEADYPSKPTIYAWLKKHPEFFNDYRGARVIRADARSDRLDDYGRRVAAGTLAPDAARVMIDIEKWQAGKENPKRYGDSTQIKHADANGDKLSLTGILNAIDGQSAGLPSNSK